MRCLFRWLTGAIVAVTTGSLAFSQEPGVNISILYTGDTHGHLRSFYYESARPVGGVAKRAIFFQEKRRHQKMVWVTLDSGDAISGTPLSDVFQGYLDIEAMNRLGYDAMALGVHEFDYGLAVLKQRISEAKFPILAANVTYADSGQPFVKPYVILDRGGVRIAVLGLTTGELLKRVAPENCVGLAVADPIETASRLVPQLEQQADVILAVTHEGINEDIRLASQVPQLDVIVGGMSQSELQVPMKVGKTLIVHDAAYAAKVGLLKLSFSHGENKRLHNHFFDCKLWPMDGRWVENTNYLAWLDTYKPQFTERMGTIVGSSAMNLSNLRVQSAETELGNYVTDILRESTGADAAVLPAAFFNGSIPEGPITLGDAFSAMPYDHYAVVLDVTGGELKSILDEASDQIGRPGFPQVSGLSFGIYNGRAYSVRVGGNDIDPFAHYHLATSDFLANGGLGYASLGTIAERQATGRLIRDLVRQRLASGQVASASMSRRMLFLGSEPTTLASAQPATPAPPEQPAEQPPAAAPEETPPSGAAPAEETPPAPEEQPAEEPGAAQPPSETPETPPEQPPAQPETGNGQGLDTLKYDRTGQPLEQPPAIQDEVITDEGSDLAAANPEGAQPAPPEETTAPPAAGEGTSPPAAGELGEPLGQASASQGGLHYELAMYAKDGAYELHLRVTNDGAAPVQLEFPTAERFDFRVYRGSDIVWNYNHNRFFLQAIQTQTVDPGESLDFKGLWPGTANDRTGLSPGVYHVEGICNLTSAPVRLGFDLTLTG
jgi:2',3'-cyclic-nucleotide 2'-phosphodiesterase (5'-nucleotidase family)